MENKGSFAELALAGVARMRDRDCDFRGRVSALLLLLRGAYYTGEEKWRVLAEEDLRALWRGGVHDHIGGGFFSACGDAEFLRPRFEKRLDDNAWLAFVYAEAWEKGRMGFYREAAEEALDFCPDSAPRRRTIPISSRPRSSVRSSGRKRDAALPSATTSPTRATAAGRGASPI